MKIKSLILGSVAAAGLSTAALAADLGTVLTSLDVCDALGVSGLTLSSDTNCLQITGGVSYGLTWGNYDLATVFATNVVTGSSATLMFPGGAPGTELDWNSTVAAWLRFEASADSSFGTAKAVVQVSATQSYTVVDEVMTTSGTLAVFLGEAFVSVGDSTVLTAGMTDSIANFDNDEPFNYLGLFNADWAGGVGMNPVIGPVTYLGTGGTVIQVTSLLNDNFSIAAALENINSGTAASDGTAVGVLAYGGDTIQANVTVLAGGILDGTIEAWGIQAGATVSMDMFQVRGAVAADSTGYWNVLGSAQAEFDMFTLALSGEAAAGAGATIQAGVGGSISAAVTDGITINLGARWWDNNTSAANTETGEVNAQLVAAVTETITISGQVGVIAENFTPNSTIYFGGEIAWAPGGGFDASVGAQANSDGAYQLSFNASKDFE
jgi:hypothetical protein